MKDPTEEPELFDQLNGMPLHPLIIHAPVIGIPLAFLLAVLFAFPRTRAWARWPLLVTVLGATAGTFTARESIKALFARTWTCRPRAPSCPSSVRTKRWPISCSTSCSVMP